LIATGQIAGSEGIPAAAWFCTKQLVSAGVGVGVNVAVQDASQKLANLLGLSPDTVQIVGDAFQLICFLNAWRIQQLALGCFVAGTEVLTMPEASNPSGYAEEPIQDVTVGQEVLTRDQNDPDGPLQEQTVTALYQHTAYAIENVSIRDASGSLETIQSTTEHPYFVSGSGWTGASQLVAGEQLIEPDGSLASVVSATMTAEPQGVTVYNFQVANDHTYFVNDGAGSVWVHNTCTGGGHYAEWELTNSNGRAVASGDEISGVDFPLGSGQKLSFPEQSWYGHTEGKIIAQLMEEGRLVAGGTLTINGELAPCSSCRGIMQWASQTFKTNIMYIDGSQNRWAWQNGELILSP
jgi:hypothetical protein